MGILVLSLVFGLIGSVVGQRKDASFAGFVLGALFGPFGILFALLSRGNLRQCPHCQSWVSKKASVCRHCHSQIGVYNLAPLATWQKVALAAIAVVLALGFVL
jgi:hypothetical protein